MTDEYQYKTALSPTVPDKVLVGRVQILESPHVSEGPGRIANAPVPSVFHDDRGSIHRIKVGNRRVNLLFSNEGVMRSGYFHNISKHIFVLSGQVEVWFLKEDGTEKKLLKAMQGIEISPYVPHILHFPSGDAVTAEWWHPTPVADLICWFYHPYRRIVDVQNSLVSSSTGHHSLLVPQDANNNNDDASSTSLTRSAVCLVTGLVMGVVLGATLATHRKR